MLKLPKIFCKLKFNVNLDYTKLIYNQNNNEVKQK